MGLNVSGDVRSLARAWLAAEPDDDLRDELQSLIDGEDATLAERFAGRLTFGTAGLRAAVGAGPLRMNRLVVRQAAAGLIDYLLAMVPDARERGVVIGWDARRKSDAFALDTARVAAVRGVKAYLMPRVVPTPVLAWNITRLGCAAGVMVTASHNPPADNGYKVYLGSGAQVVPPHDVLIAGAIGRLDPTTVPVSEIDDPLIVRLRDDVIDAYVEWAPSVRLVHDAPPIRFAYTALHGVGGEVAVRVFDHAGVGEPIVVTAQHEPDGSFPTVSFPNPEEPGAMDLVVEAARAAGASIAIANDPDADRLGVAIPGCDGAWRLLRGDEIGWLLADHVLRFTSGSDRLMVSTLVSSSLVGKMAAAGGVAYAETFTGFKWIADAASKNPDKRLVFAYEQALGYLVTDRPLDKDGITAAVVMLEVASVAAREGKTIDDRLDDIAARFGRHVTAETSVRREPAEGVTAVDRLRANPPAEIAGRRVVEVVEYPEATLLRLWLEGVGGERVRLQVRPSGTEPKVKLYGEAVGEDPTPFLTALSTLL
ncbi:MAG: phospho-sugar mutase [Actinobacteria bacterium]|nr:phospho-sugar mutase [Actinomycetota bacterium]